MKVRQKFRVLMIIETVTDDAKEQRVTESKLSGFIKRWFAVRGQLNKTKSITIVDCDETLMEKIP